MAARRRNKDAVATGLGLFGVALGATQLTAPRRLARAIGLKGDERQETVMRLMGMRELASGVGILAAPRPAKWLLARTAATSST